MAGGIKDDIWVIASEKEWCWVLGEPMGKDPNLTYAPMIARIDHDEFVCHVNGHDLRISGLEMVQGGRDIRKRVRPLPGPAPEDKPFIGSGRSPEPSFKTGWDDFDWSK